MKYVLNINQKTKKMSDEILEVEIETNGGSKYIMNIKEVDVSEWDEIPKGTKALICLVNNEHLLVTINSADYDGVSFKYIENEMRSYHYDEEVIASIFIEVPKRNNN